MNPRILADNIFSTVTPTATDTDASPEFSVLNISDGRPYTFWKASTVGTKYLIASCSTSVTVDGLGIGFHNLGTAQAQIWVEHASIGGLWMGGMAVFCPNDTGSNKISNGDFHALGTIGWTGVDCSLASITGGQSGNCLEMLRTGGTLQSAQYPITLVTGTKYRFSVFVKSGSSGIENFHAGVYDLDNAGALIERVLGTSSATWTEYSFFFTAPSTHIEIDLYKDSTTAGTMLFDSVEIFEQGDVNDHVLLKTMTSVSDSCWRVGIECASVVPYLALCSLGLTIGMPQPADSPTTPYTKSVVSDSQLSKIGYPIGSVIRYKPIEINHRFSLLDRSWVTSTFEDFWDDVLSENLPFFYAWDLDLYPSMVFYCWRKDGATFSWPVSMLAYVDSITLNLQAVQEL